LKGRKSGLFVNFGEFPCSWIRIRIIKTDPDPRHPNECDTGGSGSGSTTLHTNNRKRRYNKKNWMISVLRMMPTTKNQKNLYFQIEISEVIE
jgi:hypothetical protein